MEPMSVTFIRERPVHPYIQQARDALSSNICPSCGGPVKTDPAMIGLVKCASFGLPVGNPKCRYTGFTD